MSNLYNASAMTEAEINYRFYGNMTDGLVRITRDVANEKMQEIMSQACYPIDRNLGVQRSLNSLKSRLSLFVKRASIIIR
jgi:hypothetical protein